MAGRGGGLSPVASSAAAIIHDSKNLEIFPETLQKRLGIERWQAVSLLQELADFGYGTFVLGRRGGKTRLQKEAQLPSLTTGLPDNQSSANPSDADEQVFRLMRSKPFQVRVPADLTKDEAERLCRWVSAIAI